MTHAADTKAIRGTLRDSVDYMVSEICVVERSVLVIMTIRCLDLKF